jgi:glycosyltransferase involved in cell wall biosynthesis
MRNEEVIVYDVDSWNPTGLELSVALASLGHRVRWIFPNGTSKALAANRLANPNVDSRPRLAPPRGEALPTTRQILQRIAGPLTFIWPVLRGHPGIVIWVRDPWDGFILSAAALLVGKRLYFIRHNPESVRPIKSSINRFERLLIKRCHVIVFSEWLRDEVRKESPHHVHVVAHPNFTVTSATAPPRAPVAARVGFVGELRRDKGVESLVHALTAAGGGLEFRTIGPGHLSDEAIQVLATCGISYSAMGRLEQDKFLEELAQVDVVIAPYSQPTESGSILLCMALGVPVLALDSPMARRVLSTKSLFPDPSALGVGLREFIKRPWSTFKITGEAQDLACRNALEEALECQIPFR